MVGHSSTRFKASRVRRDERAAPKTASAAGTPPRAGVCWTFAWASSFGGDFNYDYAASATPEQLRGGGEYNFAPTGDRTQLFGLDSGPLYETAKSTGAELAEFLQEKPGMSAFAVSDGDVYHTYSAYARGLDGLWGAYQWLDRAPLGRNGDDHIWVRHDEYELALT